MAQSLDELFGTLRFASDDNSLRSALAAIKTYGEYVKRIEFTATCEDAFAVPTTPAVRPEVSILLRGTHTPNLRTIQLHFAFDLVPEGIVSEDAFEDEENAEETRTAQKKWFWRAMMNEVWAGVSANQTITELIVQDFMPEWSSTFRTAAFRIFLGRLEIASFSIWGNPDVEPEANTRQGYFWFVTKMHKPFFQHMVRLKRLELLAHHPLGGTGNMDIPLPLKPDHLPALEELKLKHCYAGVPLYEFIKGHAHVLRSLDLNECFTEPGGDGSLSTTWFMFFNALLTANLTALTDLKAGETWVPLAEDGAEDEEAARIRQKLKHDPRLRLFGYASTDDTYGFLWLEGDVNLKHFKAGNDQRSFDKLMVVAEANSARLR